MRSAAATKGKILEAAAAEFSRRGPAGARVDEIAARAGVNKASLYQHYGAKQDLYEHVLECKLAQLAELKLDAGDPADFAGRLYDFFGRNPWFVRLLLWEALDMGDHPVPSESERCARFADQVRSIRLAQASGRIDPRLDPRETLVTLVGLAAFGYAAPQALRMIVGSRAFGTAGAKRRRAHIVDAARRLTQV